MGTATPLSQKIMIEVMRRLDGLKATGTTYRHKANTVEERSVDLPDQGEDCVWVFCGDEQKDKTVELGKLHCTLPVAIRYRKTERDRSKQPRVMRELAADVSDAMSDQFEVTDDIGQPVSVWVDELTVIRHIEAPENILLDVVMDYDLTYSHDRGNHARG